MIAWAYGTGSADQEEDDYNAYKMWEAHCDNPAANFIRRGEVMSLNAGISVCPDETVGACIGSFPWTGQDMDGIGRGEIWGTDEDEYILTEEIRPECWTTQSGGVFHHGHGSRSDWSASPASGDVHGSRSDWSASLW